MRSKIALGIWMICCGAIGYCGWEFAKKVGSGEALERMIKDLDNGDTVIVEKRDGSVIHIKKDKEVYAN